MSTGGSLLLAMGRGARRTRLGEYLRLVGVDAREVSTGAEALGELLARLPDAVVADTQLEDMPGLRLLELVRGTPQFAPTVFVLLGGEESAAFGMRDLAMERDMTPQDLVRELRLILSEGPEVAFVNGTFENLGWMGVLRALNQGRRTGLLRVRVLSSEADVWLSAGQIVHARYGVTQGEAAMTALHNGMAVMLNAEYEFEAGELAGVTRTIRTPTPVLLGRSTVEGG